MGPKKISAAQWLALSFLILIFTGSILLYLPWASVDGHTRYIDCLFVATSATCVTGLVPLDTGTNWTIFGQLVILLLIQVGGLGVMAFAAFFALLLGQKIQLHQRLIMQQAINTSAVGGIVRVFKYLLIFTFASEALGALILTIRWAGDWGWGKAVWYGVFHAVSAFNNAGFDLMGGFKSLIDYNGDITVNLAVTTLIILGGLGFYVTYELYNYPRQRKLSIHSRVVLIMTAALITTGTLLLFASEYNHALKEMPLGAKLLASYFQSVTTRTAGFNTIDISALYQSSQLVIIFLMFVGASPGSTGGGIKTSTFAIIWLSIYSQMRGKKDTEIFERRLDNQDVIQALTVFMLFSLTLMVMTFLVSLTHRHDLVKVFFEVASALGTVGLTLGLTPELNTLAKVWIILTMFLGRVGPLTLGFALAYKQKQPEIHFPTGKIMIG